LLSAAALGAAAFGATAARAGDASVTIDNFTFNPAEITIAVGTKVTWTNRDDIPHTVTDAGDPRQFKSSPLDTGDTFDHVFTAPRTCRYFCSIHPHMQGTIIVK
jgi:plastocyanin